jgi:hypothetical protein
LLTYSLTAPGFQYRHPAYVKQALSIFLHQYQASAGHRLTRCHCQKMGGSFVQTIPLIGCRNALFLHEYLGANLGKLRTLVLPLGGKDLNVHWLLVY